MTAGYENNPDGERRRPSPNGWFRTGDQGTLDAEGYLRITGRLKEIINRGGEKISPARGRRGAAWTTRPWRRSSPSPCRTTSSARTSRAAVVLREGHRPTERELRDFAAERLAAFKVPRKIVFLDEIPKGATGKLQRIGLAQKLGLV